MVDFSKRLKQCARCLKRRALRKFDTVPGKTKKKDFCQDCDEALQKIYRERLRMTQEEGRKTQKQGSKRRR